MKRSELTICMALLFGAAGCVSSDSVLTRDIALDAPMLLETGTTLDCDGHSIVPAKGKPAPEVGIMISGARDVAVKNCAVSGFDFGIVVVNARNSKQIELASNVIKARVGIEIIASDHLLVRNNNIEYGSNGVGIVAWGDSDFNVYRDNTIVARDAGDSKNGPQWPGAVPTAMRPDGIRTYSGTQARTVINTIVSGRLTQTVSDVATKQEGTVIEGNHIDIPVSGAGDGGYAICVADQTNSVVRENTVGRALQGLHVSGHMGMLRPAGTCSANPMRFCTEARDCFLPGVDRESLGSCQLPEPVYTFSTSTGLRFVSNHIAGPLTQPRFDCAPDAECGGVHAAGIAVYPNAISIVVEDNDVSDVQFAGIWLLLKSVESAIVRRNVVRNSAYALALISVPPGTMRAEYPSHYGAIVSRNDFIGSRWRPVYVSQSFNLRAELSEPATGEGNYWGHPCATAFSATDSPRANVTDSHPFGEPVAHAPSAMPCVQARQ